MPETIKAGEQNLDKVFCNDYLFEIPRYQRPYAWTKDEVGELLDDLLFAMDRGKDVPYFLGSIVLIKGDGPDSKVIDGQQRLTTLTILLCTLRELAEEPMKTALDERVRQRPNPLTKAPEVVRLRLRPLDQDFFHANVQTAGAIPGALEMTTVDTDSQQRIVENSGYLYGELSSLDRERRDELSSFIIRHCYLVVVSTTDMSSAYRIFSVMNDRGLNLGPTDILKAEVIGNIGEARQQEYSDKWENIEQELGRSRFGELFVHIRMVYAKAKARRNLQDEFRDFVLENGGSSTDFIDDILEPYAEAYESVLGMSDAGVAGDYRVVECLGSLRRLDNYDWIPPAIAFFHGSSADSDGRRQFIIDLERLAYGLFIRRADINERVNRYAAILQSMEKGEDILQPEGHLQLRAKEKEAIMNALNGPVYTLPRVPKPLLLRLDGLLAGTGARYDHSIISIEHVLPQRPGEGSTWLRWFADDEERALWTHRLANLVLLSRRKNGSASNLDFGPKKTRYFARGGVSPFALTTQVVNEEEWTPAVLMRRQDALVAKLKEEWRLE